MKKPRWILGGYEYEWNAVTSRTFLFWGEETTEWVLSEKGRSWNEALKLTPARYRAMRKRQMREPCKIKSGFAYEIAKGQPESERAFDLYWFRDAFYGVKAELKNDEIGGFIEDYEEQLKSEIRERNSRKAKALENVRARIRGRGKTK
jgi:hypothetical protein